MNINIQLNKNFITAYNKMQEKYGTDIAEIHHIVPFSVSQDNSIGNLIVLCPNHHRLLHKGKAEYDPEAKSFSFSGGNHLRVILNDHL